MRRYKDAFTYDIRGAKPSILYLLKRLIMSPQYRVVVYYRIAEQLTHEKFRGFKIFGHLILSRISRVPGVEIGCNSKIGPGLKIAHAHDIVIGDQTIIGRNATIYNGVTFGAKNDSDGVPRYPSVGDNVTIYPGAKIIGNVEIGDNAVIGANSVVLSSVMVGDVVAGVPAKKINSAYSRFGETS